jgi:hypothetical protein
MPEPDKSVTVIVAEVAEEIRTSTREPAIISDERRHELESRAFGISHTARILTVLDSSPRRHV